MGLLEEEDHIIPSPTAMLDPCVPSRQPLLARSSGRVLMFPSTSSVAHISFKPCSR